MDEDTEGRVTDSRPKATILTKIGGGRLEVISSKLPFRRMARVTGLEPAASGVTGRRSNQLSYTRVVGPRNYDAGEVLSRPNSHFFFEAREFSAKRSA